MRDIRRLGRERRSRSAAASRPTACAARSPPPRPSAGAGPGSSTTRRCRRSAACACCSPLQSARSDAETQTSRRCVRRSTTSSTRSRTCVAIITDLRPSLLDDLGLLPAIEALIERRRAGGLDDHRRADATRAHWPGRGAMAPELETTVYRLVQEALTNVVKHARASVVHVSVTARRRPRGCEVSDDGDRLRHRREDRGLRSRRHPRADLPRGRHVRVAAPAQAARC